MSEDYADLVFIRVYSSRNRKFVFCHGQCVLSGLTESELSCERYRSGSVVCHQALIIYCRIAFIRGRPLYLLIHSVIRNDCIRDLIHKDMHVILNDVVFLAESNVFTVCSFLVRQIFGRDHHILSNRYLRSDDIACFIFPSDEDTTVFLRIFFRTVYIFFRCIKTRTVCFSVNDESDLMDHVIYHAEILLDQPDPLSDPILKPFDILVIGSVSIREMQGSVLCCRLSCLIAVSVNDSAILSQSLKRTFHDSPLLMDFLHKAAFSAVIEHGFQPFMAIRDLVS